MGNETQSLRTEQEIKKRIELYKKEYAKELQKPLCSSCVTEDAVLTDELLGEDLCEKCFDKDIREDLDTLFEYTDKLLK